MHPPALGALKATDFPWKLLRRDRGVGAEGDTAAERELVAATVVAAATELDNAATQDAMSSDSWKAGSSERVSSLLRRRRGGDGDKWEAGGDGEMEQAGGLRRGNLAMADGPTATLS